MESWKSLGGVRGKGIEEKEGKPEMSGNPSTGKTNGEFQESGEKTAS
jgi:hypothetical protein